MSSPAAVSERLRRGKERAREDRIRERVRNLAAQLRTLDEESLPAAQRLNEFTSKQLDQASDKDAEAIALAGAADEHSAYVLQSLSRLRRRVEEELHALRTSGRGAGANGSGRPPARGAS